MYSQITDTVFMIKPIQFRRNEETAVNNYFQQDMSESIEEIQNRALDEFDLFVEKLRENGIEVIVFTDTDSSVTPDSIFPNNWITLHDDGTILLYPMYAPNRRLERRDDIIKKLKEDFFVDQVYSFTDWEEKGLFLEGTGSMILDRPNKVVYAALSDRTSIEVLSDFHEVTGYEIISFRALQTVDNERLPIYHTNVMMAVGENFALICLDCIDNPVERARVEFSLIKSGKEIIKISEEQVSQFAGNILNLRNKSGQSFIVMSLAAHESLNKSQRKALKKHGKLLYSPIPTIELLGGGGVRCMMAEVFLPTPTIVRK